MDDDSKSVMLGRRDLAAGAVAFISVDAGKSLKEKIDSPTKFMNAHSSIAYLVSDADFTIVECEGEVFVGLSELTTNRIITLPGSPEVGMKVIVKDRDGGMLRNAISVVGNGNAIDGKSTLQIDSIQYGTRGSVTLYFNGTDWSVV